MREKHRLACDIGRSQTAMTLCGDRRGTRKSTPSPPPTPRRDVTGEVLSLSRVITARRVRHTTCFVARRGTRFLDGGAHGGLGTTYAGRRRPRRIRGRLVRDPAGRKRLLVVVGRPVYNVFVRPKKLPGSGQQSVWVCYRSAIFGSKSFIVSRRSFFPFFFFCHSFIILHARLTLHSTAGTCE